MEAHRAFEHLADEGGAVAESAGCGSFLDIAGLEVEDDGRLDLEDDRGGLGQEGELGDVNRDSRGEFAVVLVRIRLLRFLPEAAEFLGPEIGVVGAGGEMGLLDRVKEREIQFGALGEADRLAGSGREVELCGEGDLRVALLRTGDHFLHPVLVVADGVEGDLGGLEVDHVFLELLAVVVEGVILFLRVMAVFDVDAVLELVAEVAFQHRVVLRAECLVMELHVVLDALEPHEDEGAEAGEGHEDLEPAPLAHLERSPREHHRDRGGDEDEGVDQARQHRERALGPRVICPEAQEDVGGEEAAEEHDFRREEEPDGDLRVEEAGVLARGEDVGDFHWKDFLVSG